MPVRTIRRYVFDEPENRCKRSHMARTKLLAVANVVWLSKDRVKRSFCRHHVASVAREHAAYLSLIARSYDCKIIEECLTKLVLR